MAITPGLSVPVDSVSDAQEEQKKQDTLALAKANTVKVGKTTLPALMNPIGVDESILENMQKVIAEKQAQRSSFMESLRDAQAWWSGGLAGPGEALAKRAAEREGQAQAIFDMQSQLAQYKTAQKLAEAQKLKDAASGWSTTGGAGATATGGAGATATGGAGATATGGANVATGAPAGMPYMTPDVINQYERIRDTLGQAKAEEFRAGIIKQYTDRKNAYDLNPALDAIVKFPYQGRLIDMTLRQAAELARNNPDLPQSKAILQQVDKVAPSAGGAAVPVSVRNNNPGNLVDPKTGKIKVFDTPEEGEAALDADVEAKLGGKSAAFKTRFGDLPVTPGRLAEVWSPAAAAGNSALSTSNYGAAIAKELGIGVGDTIPNTPEAIEAVKRAITRFEAGTTATAEKKPFESYQVASTGVTPPPPSAGKNLTSTEIEQINKQKEAIAEAELKDAGKNIALQRAANEEAYDSARDIITDADFVTGLATNPKTTRAFGVLQHPTVIAAFLGAIDEGASAGNLGLVRFNGVENAVRKLGGTPDEIVAAQLAASKFAKMGLAQAKIWLKGQGTVTEHEREKVEQMVGSMRNSPEAVRQFLTWTKLRAQFDELNGAQWSAFKHIHGKTASYEDYKQTKDYQDAKNDYAKKLDALSKANLRAVTGEKHKATGLLDKYK